MSEEKPRVLVTAGSTSEVGAYVHALDASGAEPVVARPGSRALELDGVAGVLITGGVDVSPARYGAVAPEHVAATVQVDEARDALEWYILDEADRRGLPVLAICRGIQVVNAHRGGTLRLHLPAEGFTLIDHRQRERLGEPVHEVVLSPSRLRTLLGGAVRLQVNSSHHQAVRQVAPDLTVVAHAPDGIIEGIESADGRLIGVQWHPERLYDTHDEARRLFTDLVTRATGQIQAPLSAA